MIAICSTINAIAGQPVNVFVGGCVERGEGSRFRAQAHAHTGKADDRRGWICVLSRRRLGPHAELPTNAGIVLVVERPSRLLMHELAHVLTGHGHDDAWRRKMREFGQPLPRQYRREARGMHRHRWKLVRTGDDGWQHFKCSVPRCGAYKGLPSSAGKVHAA